MRNSISGYPFYNFRGIGAMSDLNATAVVREWVNGETFLYWVRAYRLALVAKTRSGFSVERGALVTYFS